MENNSYDENRATENLDSMKVPDVTPILSTDGVVIYPYVTARIVVPQRHKALLRDAMAANRLIGVVAGSSLEQPDGKTPAGNEIGTLIRINDLSDLPDGSLLIGIKGLMRIRIMETLSSEPYPKARIAPIEETVGDEIKAEALRRQLVRLSKEVISMSPQIPDEVGKSVEHRLSIFQLSYVLAGNIKMKPSQQLAILRHDPVEKKMEILIDLLKKELDILAVSESIKEKVSDKMSSQQREYHLRQQMAAIRKELGEDDTAPTETDDYADRIEQSAMPLEAKNQAERELKRLTSMSPHAAEYPVIRNYLDWLLDIPWNEPESADIDLNQARKDLDNAHFGMDQVKAHIIEYLAVHQLQSERKEQLSAVKMPVRPKGAILCLVGPPGTGKTSLGQSIATAMGRSYARMSLGGIRDESEIRGHRRTYVGAMPGRIIQAIKRAGSRNPVFILDEVDKVGQDWRGDPSSALLEVLDPEQNANFRDHYLDVDYDLSEVVFIATANYMDRIPEALRDRMDVISLEGYTEYEKFQIAKRHLIPRQLAASGLFENEVTFMDEAIQKIIHDYTREAGVRNLERLIGTICRKSAVALQKNSWHSVAITADQVREFLKKEKYEHDMAETLAMPGIATGLAVTGAGGEILHIEATRMPGKGRLMLTGQMGEVMKESAQIAHSYVRSRADALGIPLKLFETQDVHLHIPAGALPKDGPSAGVVMTLAMASAFTGRLVPVHFGATGEVTLRGRVLPVGGVKMKLLAAHRAGLTHIAIPARNRRDIEELPEEITAAMRIDSIENMDDVLATVFPDDTARTKVPPDTTPCEGPDCKMISAEA